jgi:hypothetical protein
MEVATEMASVPADTGRFENFDLGFLPQALTTQCRSLIESYHEVHGYICLPDVLWKSRLAPLIQSHPEFRQLLRKASTTRSAKKSSQGFAQIATTILALEILASSFAGWSAIYPEAGAVAEAILKRNARRTHMPLMEFYLYPPKYISLAAIATLAPPSRLQSDEIESYHTSKSELAGEKLPISHVSSIREGLEGKPQNQAAISSV